MADDGTQVFRLASRGKLGDCFERLDHCGADADLIVLAKECLELEPQARPRNAGVLAERITGYLESVEAKLRATELARVEAQARAEELRRRRKLSYALAGLLLVGLIGTAVAASHFRSLEHTQRNLATSNQQLANEREAERNAAVVAREEAKRERDAAQQAQREAVDQTYLARLSEVRALRLGRSTGWRSMALDQLREMALLESRYLDRVELRSEAIACLAELDVRPEPRNTALKEVTWRFQYSPDGRAMAIPDDRAPGSPVVVQDLAENRDLLSIPRAGLFAPFAFHPSGTLAVETSPGSVTWHPVRPGQPKITGDGNALNLAFSRSGERLAIAWGSIRAENAQSAGEFRQVTVHDASTGELLWTLKTPDGTPGG